MPRPAPRYISAITANNIAMARMRLQEILRRTNPMHPIGVAVNPDDAAGMCRLAGLACDYPTLRARAVSIGKPLPGVDVIRSVGGVAQEIVRPDVGEMWRAWAVAYADDLIDPAAEQSDIAARVWMWW